MRCSELLWCFRCSLARRARVHAQALSHTWLASVTTPRQFGSLPLISTSTSGHLFKETTTAAAVTLVRDRASIQNIRLNGRNLRTPYLLVAIASIAMPPPPTPPPPPPPGPPPIMGGPPPPPSPPPGGAMPARPPAAVAKTRV
jgi:hypothetical protein